jgi:hypothetical protein
METRRTLPGSGPLSPQPPTKHMLAIRIIAKGISKSFFIFKFYLLMDCPENIFVHYVIFASFP